MSPLILALLLQLAPSADDDAKPYLHKAAGFTCPASTSQARRVSVRQYDDAGRDVSCGFQLASGATITVYFYPLGDSSADHAYSATKASIRSITAVLSEGPFSIGHGSSRVEGRRGVFTVRFENAPQVPPLRSEVFVGQRGQALVKVRTTFAHGSGEKAVKAAEEFLRAFPFSFPDEKQQ
jgi:hypothetical protein